MIRNDQHKFAREISHIDSVDSDMIIFLRCHDRGPNASIFMMSVGGLFCEHHIEEDHDLEEMKWSCFVCSRMEGTSRGAEQMHFTPEVQKPQNLPSFSLQKM